MNARFPVAAIVFAAVLVAVVIGVTWAARRSHTAVEVAPAQVDLAVLPRAKPPSYRAPAPASDPRTSPAATRQRLLGRGRDVSAAVAAGRTKLKARYDSEPVDAAWARRKERALASANDAPQISELGAKPLAFSSQCRSSVCLVAADFPSTLAAEDWVSLYTLVAGPEVSRAAVQRSDNPDGSIHLQVYAFAR